MINRVLRFLGKLLIALMVLILLAALAFGVFVFIKNRGKNSLAGKGSVKAPSIAGAGISSDESTSSDWEDDWIIYKGDIYDYNDDIRTFLIMGIDKTDEEVKGVYGEIDGGQADALFLVVCNPHDKSIKVIGINRNTMTDVDIYDEQGKYVRTVTAQIAVQHGFGDGLEKSCELQKYAVSKLFYSLPIHGYAAVNMSAIPVINDAVGGVDITVRESFDTDSYSFKSSEKVHLDGSMAYSYLHDRDVSKLASADRRMLRQKDYLSAYIDKLRDSARSDPGLVADIFLTVQRQMTTDMTPDEVLYLSTTTASYTYSQGDFYLLDGYTNVGGAFEEFHPNMDKLLDMMVDIFYEKV